MTEKAVKVIVSGRVQGVGYRAWTACNARQLELNGWVRNRADGTVEALFAGTAVRVEDMVKRCFEGPPAARVDGVEVNDAQGIVDAGFKQLPTV